MHPLIQLDGVTKLYGRVIGVNDFSIELAPGAYGLLGPNGSGKSTLLNLITGQLRPSLGQVRVMGESPLNNHALYRRIGYCPSSEGMYAHVTALQWVRYLLELYGMSASKADKAAKQALDFVGMTYAMNREISGYSRGMRQRTKLAQAIAHDPDFLLLDEPFSGLDPVARHDMTVALRQWIADGKSLLLASHVLHEVESVTPSFLLICSGRLLASGTAEEVNELLVDLPNDITVRTSQPHALAQRLMERSLVDSARIETDHVVISTRAPSQLLAELPTWTSEPENVITEVRSADESLNALFNTLMQIHRGEV